MDTQPRCRNLLSEPGTPGFLEDLYQGQFHWNLISPFPWQESQAREVGDDLVARLRTLLAQRVDPVEVDQNGRLPDKLLDELAAGGFLRLQVPADLGGLDLSSYNVFRLVEAAASWSVPAALVMAIETAVGLGSFLPALPEGRLRDYVRGRLADPVVSGSADTEPSGSANTGRTTRAVPTPDGSAYLLTGVKIHVGNASIADVLAVTATVREDGRDIVRLFFVETDSPGFRIAHEHTFMGVRGFPNASATLDNVRVPAERMFVEDLRQRNRITPHITRSVVRGRLHMITAPSLAIARNCLRWSRDFLLRRNIDGRPLGDYQEIKRLVATTAAEVFAIDTVARWCLLGEDRTDRELNVTFEQNAAKNIGSVTAWRIVDRTMSLLAGEGFETEQSKADRGAPPLPLERAFRDARNFRISGGVDFQIDNWTACLGIFSYYYPQLDDIAAIESDWIDPALAQVAGLSPRNREHLVFVAGQVRRFGQECLRLSRRYRGPQDLFADQHTVITLSGTANELLTMSLVLARTATLAETGAVDAQHLADVYCTAARYRLAEAWQRITADGGPDYRQVAANVLDGRGLEFLFG